MYVTKNLEEITPTFKPSPLRWSRVSSFCSWCTQNAPRSSFPWHDEVRVWIPFGDNRSQLSSPDLYEGRVWGCCRRDWAGSSFRSPRHLALGEDENAWSNPPRTRPESLSLPPLPFLRRLTWRGSLPASVRENPSTPRLARNSEPHGGDWVSRPRTALAWRGRWGTGGSRSGCRQKQNKTISVPQRDRDSDLTSPR